MALGSTNAFRPSGTVSITAGTASTAVPLNGGGSTTVVNNTAASLAFVRFGTDATVTASSADMPIQAGGRAMLDVNPVATYVAVVLASGSGTVLVTRGDGTFI